MIREAIQSQIGRSPICSVYYPLDLRWMGIINKCQVVYLPLSLPKGYLASHDGLYPRKARSVRQKIFKKLQF